MHPNRHADLLSIPLLINSLKTEWYGKKDKQILPMISDRSRFFSVVLNTCIMMNRIAVKTTIEISVYWGNVTWFCGKIH